MKKIYAILGSALLALPVLAEQPQLPNNGFEDNWEDCIPWNSKGSSVKTGKTPTPWTISHVSGVKIFATQVGATVVGEQVAGYNSASAVKVYNSENSAAKGVAVPGFVTLGTPWSTSVMNKSNDGGTFGGISFTGRPEKITFMYKFEGENTQPVNAIAYLWKGSCTQANVPANIVATGKPTPVDMIDRDRNVLKMEKAETTLGGDVKYTEDFELIAKGTFSTNILSSDWAKGEIVLEYFSEATPEKINVIFAANDYFKPTGQVFNNAFTVDDVKCEYAAEPEPTPVPEGDPYAGKLEIFYGDGKTPLTPEGGKDDTVYINQLTPNTCSFKLPNFILGEGEDVIHVGDIFLPEVSMTFGENDLTTFYSKVNGLKLGQNGEINADVTLNGTADKEGNAKFNIDVIWVDLQVPIYVTFNGKGKGGFTGVSDITADDANAPVLYYNLQGVRVDNPQNGLYIRVQGKKATKVAIR